MKFKRKEIFNYLILVIISILLWNSFIKSYKLFDKVTFGFYTLLISFLTIYDLLKHVKENFIFKQIYFLFDCIFNITFKLAIVFKVIFEPFIVFILIFSVQYILLRLVFLIFNYSIGPEITFILLLITLVLFAYKGVYLTYLFHSRFLKNKGEIYTKTNEMTVKLLSEINFRKRIYEIMILMYIVFTIEELSANLNIDNIYWTNYSEISLKILLTFVAIDGYVNTFMPEVIKKEREQYKEIKQYYSLD